MSEEINTPPGDNGAPIDTPSIGAPPAEKSFSDFVPEGYREKEYLKGVDSFDRLFQDFDNAQKMIGKKSIPGQDASDEEWNEFYNKLRPESADKYEFQYAEGTDVDEKFSNSMKDIFHKAGLSQKQALQLQQGYDAIVAEMSPSQDEINAKFDELADKTFGARRDQALGNAKNMISKFAPSNMKDAIDSLGNNELVILASVLDGVHSEYLSEDSMNNNGSTGGSRDPRAEARELMNSEAYKNVMHPEHDNIKQKLRDLYKSMN